MTKLLVKYQYKPNPDKHIISLSLKEPRKYGGIQILNYLADTNFSLQIWEKIFNILEPDCYRKVELMVDGNELRIILLVNEKECSVFLQPFKKGYARDVIDNLINRAIEIARSWKEERVLSFEYIRFIE